MNRTEHLLTIAMEECAEVEQRISKALRFGLDQIQQDADDKPEENPEQLDNRERIHREFTDLVAVLEMAGISTVVSRAACEAKVAKVERYLERSARCGTLQDWQPIETIPTDDPTAQFLVKDKIGRVNRAFYLNGELAMVGGQWQPFYWMHLPR